MKLTTMCIVALLTMFGCAHKLYEYDSEGNARSSLCPCIKVTPENLIKLEKKAVNGDAESALVLAKYYGSTAKNDEKELFWYQVAGYIGDTTGMINAGYIYESHKKPEESLVWYLRAAEKDPGEAYSRIADLYKKTSSFENNFKLAREYYKKAALHGNIYAIDDIVKASHEGIGGVKDNVEAYAWILAKSHTLFPESWAANELEELRKAVRSEMTDEEVKRAEEFCAQYLIEMKKWRKNLLPNCEDDGIDC